MAQNLVVNGTTYNGVDSLSMTNKNGEKVIYVEKVNVGGDTPVAKIGDREFYTVEEALVEAVSGETVTLINNSIEHVTLIIPNGVTLNLNDKTLTADYIVGVEGGCLVDSNNTGVGKVIIAKESLVLHKTNSGTVPIYVGDGYIFTTFMYNFSQDTSYTGTGFKIKALYAPNLSVVNVLKNGALDNNIDIGIMASWSDNTAFLKFDEETVATVFSSNKGTVTGYNNMFTMTINGFDNIQNLAVNLLVVSGTNARSTSSKTITINTT